MWKALRGNLEYLPCHNNDIIIVQYCKNKIY